MAARTTAGPTDRVPSVRGTAGTGCGAQVPPATPVSTAATVAAVLVALGLAASSASAAHAPFNVTVKAQMAEKWSFNEASTDDCNLTGVLCARTTAGAGTASVKLQTTKPQRVDVFSGGARPTINTGTDGIRLRGVVIRDGTLTTTYGGPWAGANPNQSAPTTGCGRRDVSGGTGLMWSGAGGLAMVPTVELDRSGCPTGPGPAVTWVGGKAPSLGAVLAEVSASRLLRSNQLTVRGTRTFTGTYPTAQRSSATGSFESSGTHQVTWRWAATFRKTRRE